MNIRLYIGLALILISLTIFFISVSSKNLRRWGSQRFYAQRLSPAMTTLHFDRKGGHTRSEYIQSVVEIGAICFAGDMVILPVTNDKTLKHVACKLLPNCTTPQSQTEPRQELFDPSSLPVVIRDSKDKILFWNTVTNTYSGLIPGNHTEIVPYHVSVISGTSILIDTCVGAMQFGHGMTAALKLLLLVHGDDRFEDSIAHVVDVYWKSVPYPRWKSAVLDAMFSWVNDTNKRVDQRPFLLRQPDFSHSMTCFERMVKPACSERYFYSPKDVHVVQEYTRKRIQHFQPTLESCPPPKAAVLYRSGEGAGLRKILNFDAVVDALQENGISSYHNITVAQNTSLEQSLETFSSFGLLISTHSSQLKLLAFSHPDTVVIEVRPTESKDWYGHSVFSEGPDILGIHYFSNSKHMATPCPLDALICQRKGNIYSDIWLNKTELSFAIREGIRKQKRRCRLEWT